MLVSQRSDALMCSALFICEDRDFLISKTVPHARDEGSVVADDYRRRECIINFSGWPVVRCSFDLRLQVFAQVASTRQILTNAGQAREPKCLRIFEMNERVRCHNED